MRKLLILFIGIAFIACDTKNNYIDTGVSKGKHDCCMMEYFATNSYDWDSTVLVIERAGVEDIFTGQNPDYKEITFFGPTNHSIRRWMIENSYEKVSDIPVNVCEEMILKHIVKNKYMKADIAFANPKYTATDPNQDGGTDLTTVGGNVIYAYKIRGEWGGVPGAGAIDLKLYSRSLLQKIPMASADIECNNGVVHSLNYTYTFGQI
jgi:hypothetical protein